MKVLLDCGHTLSGADTGAEGNGRREQDLTREVGYKVKSKLEMLGHSVIVCNCDNASTLGESLSYRVNKANSNGGDLFISIHFNAGGGLGTEVYTYSGKEIPEARNILNNICALGYINRGLKDGSSLYVLRHTNMQAMLIECCFIDTADINRYNAEDLANAIVKGITGREVEGELKMHMDKVILYTGDIEAMSAIIIGQKYKCPVIKKTDFEAKGYKADEIIVIGGKTGSDRYSTFRDAANLV